MTEQRFLQRPPKITTNLSLLIASMPVYTSPVSLSEGLRSLGLYSGKLDFAAFCWLRAEQKYFLGKTVAKTVLEFSVLRNLHRNVECRHLKHWQGLGLCHCISGH